MTTRFRMPQLLGGSCAALFAALTLSLSPAAYSSPPEIQALAPDAELPRLDVPYVPTPQDVVERMLQMADVQSDDYLIDLGSGDGRIVVTAVQKWEVKEALGIDLDPQRVAEARENAEKAGVSEQAAFEQGDLFEKDLSGANVVTMYLLQWVNERLRPVILETMEPGTRIVSHAFDMGDWRPDQEDQVGGSRIYLWIVPAQVEGSWRLQTGDDQDITLTLTQSYQYLQGTAESGDRMSVISDAQLQGNQISFTIGSERYMGTVQGDKITPVAGAGTADDWHARRL